MLVWQVKREAAPAGLLKQTARSPGTSNWETATVDAPKARRDRRTLSTGTSRWVKVRGTYHMTRGEPPVYFSGQGNIRLPVRRGEARGALQKNNFFFFLSPKGGVWQERLGAFVPGRERASGRAPPRDR